MPNTKTIYQLTNTNHFLTQGLIYEKIRFICDKPTQKGYNSILNGHEGYFKEGCKVFLRRFNTLMAQNELTEEDEKELTFMFEALIDAKRDMSKRR